VSRCSCGVAAGCSYTASSVIRSCTNVLYSGHAYMANKGSGAHTVTTAAHSGCAGANRQQQPALHSLQLCIAHMSNRNISAVTLPCCACCQQGIVARPGLSPVQNNIKMAAGMLIHVIHASQMYRWHKNHSG
jgi:hypothetical protein